MQHGAKLTVKYDTKKPVDLADLSLSLHGLSEEYKMHVECSVDPMGDEGVRLSVKEIRPGSIIVELVAIAPQALQFPENATHIRSFTTRLQIVFDFLLGGSVTELPLAHEPTEPPIIFPAGKAVEDPHLERANYKNLGRIIEPIAKEGGSQLNISATDDSAEPPVLFTMSSVSANAIQNRIRRELELLKQPSSGIHEKVLLYWFQARNDPKGKAGDRAIIESLHDRPVKAVFMTDSIKGKILSAAENLFRMAYVVDVSVETIAGRPALYRILELHDVIERNNGAEN